MPHESQTYDPETKTYKPYMGRRNVNLQVVAATLDDVLPAVREQHPDSSRSWPTGGSKT